MTTNLIAKLEEFENENEIVTPGRLSAVIQITRMVKEKGFPVKPEDYKTDSEGQVSGLSGSRLKKILKEYEITQTLTSEGGRTNRGNMKVMIAYAALLNALNADGQADIDSIELFWAERIKAYFRTNPFTLSADKIKTIGTNLEDLFEQARQREREKPGSRYFGVVLQHLVAAKLSIILPPGSFEIFGVTVADNPTGRKGDFVIKNTVIHCTTMPSDTLMDKCRANLNEGCHPVIITTFDCIQTAHVCAKRSGLEDRIEVWDIQQFLSSNVYEHSRFNESEMAQTLSIIIEKYNEIISEYEKDQSLRIKFNQ